MRLLVYSWIVYLIIGDVKTQNNQCGGSNINRRTTICCNGLAYVKSGPKPGCCGSVGFDAHHYYCCGKTIMRKDKYKVPKCCGEKGYDGMFDVCVDGYLDKKSDLGSHCCVTEMGWKCCPRGGTCCQFAGSGQVEIPGFRPACCELRSYSEKAECCANTVEMTGVMPSCCDNEQYRPKCCVGNDGTSECCPANTGTCCRHLITYPEPYRPKPTNSYYRPTAYPIAATRPPYTDRRSDQQCCTSTRRTCCSKPISRDAVQPCCYSLTKPSCCYTSDKYQPSCCMKNMGNGHRFSGIPNLKTAKVGRYNGMRTAKVGRSNEYRSQISANYNQGINRPHYKPEDNKYDYNRGRPAGNQKNYNYNRGRPSDNQNNHNYNRGRPSNNQNNYNYNRGRPSDNRNNYDYNRGRPSDNRNHYDYNRGRPSNNQNYHFSTTRPSDNQNNNNKDNQYNENRGRPSYNQNQANTNRPYTDQSQYNNRGRPTQNRNEYQTETPSNHHSQYSSCCNALSQMTCCSEGYRATGRVPECCPSSTTNGKMRPMYKTPDPEFVQEGNQAFHGIHFNMHPTDWAPEVEIIDQNMYYPHRGSNRIRTKEPVTEPKYVPDYENAQFGGIYSRTGEDNNVDSLESVTPKKVDIPNYITKENMYINVNVYKPTTPHDERHTSREDIAETVTPYPVEEEKSATQPGYENNIDNEMYESRTFPNNNDIDNNILYNPDKETEKPFPYLPKGGGLVKGSGFVRESELEESLINDEDEDENILIPLPEEPPLGEYKPDHYSNYYDMYDYDHMKCNGEPYDLGVHICCDGVLKYRIGVEPKCCSTEAYDAFLYKCCDGVIRRSCDPNYEPQKTSWGKFI